MKNYVNEFDELVQIASQTDMSDAELLTNARSFIQELQNKVEELANAKIQEVAE